MKPLTHSAIRRIIFSAYLVITVLFCLVIYISGRLEVNYANRLSETEHSNFEMLNRCREKLSAATAAVSDLISEPNEIRAAEAELKIREVRRICSDIKIISEGRPQEYSMRINEMLSSARLAQAGILACISDLEEPDPERSVLFSSTAESVTGALNAAGDSLQILIRQETDQVRNGQAKYLRFFSRLQIYVIAFFVTAVIFTLLGSIYLDVSLKKSLKRLSEGTRELRSGNMEYRFRQIEPDETGQVMYDFNLMARRIEMQSGDLMKANDELRHQAEELIAAHQHKDRFLSNMSHELRTPLNSVIGFAELMEERAGTISQDKIKHHSHRIVSAAEHLLELITSLLDLAKSGAGTLKPVSSSFDLGFLVSETAQMLRPLAEKKGLTLKFETVENLHVTADKRMINQILINLIGNAIKFTQSGSVSVRASREDSGWFKIEVEDTGIGIKESEFPNIFKDFHRVDNGPAHLTEGVGIGLALSRRLVDLHGGSIIFKSEFGKGSVFTVMLPPGQTAKKEG